MHTGEFSQAGQQRILDLCNINEGFHEENPARFVELNRSRFWTVPKGVDPTRWRTARRYSAGYRHMCRFFLIGIYPLLHEQGFEYIWRLDEDSYIWSPIRYNIFDFMRARQLTYAYRLLSTEHELATRGTLHGFVREYALARGLQSKWLLERCAIPRMVNFSIELCGPPQVPYNNFYVSRVGFWLTPEVQDMLQHIDQTNWIYTARIGDHIWSAFVLMLLLRDPARHVHRFDDFAYEHITTQTWLSSPGTGTGGVERNVTCLMQGAFAIGSARPDLGERALARTRELFHPPIVCENARYCVRDPDHHVAWDQDTRDFNSEPPRGYFVGPVSDEQYSCSQSPQPYYCRLPRRVRHWDTGGGFTSRDIGQGYLREEGAIWNRASVPGVRVPTWEEDMCRASPLPRNRSLKLIPGWPAVRLRGCARRGRVSPQTCSERGWAPGAPRE